VCYSKALVFIICCRIVAKKFEELQGHKGGKKDKTPQKPPQQQQQKQEKKKPEPKKPEEPPAKQVNCVQYCHILTAIAHSISSTMC